MSHPILSWKSLVLTVLVAAGVSAGVVGWIVPRGGVSIQANGVFKSVLPRILETGVIRAGYIAYPPLCVVDPTTHAVSGIFAEALENIASRANLKVEWVEEAGFSSMVEGLNLGRYDIMPCGVWGTTVRAQRATLTRPFVYSSIKAWARQDDTRFAQGLAAINDSSITVGGLDGSMSLAIAKMDFPEAKTISLPNLTSESQVLLDVVHKRADVTFTDAYQAQLFVKQNPGTLVQVGTKPVRVFPNVMMVPMGDFAFRSFLDAGIEEITNLGLAERLIQKYAPEPGTFLFLRSPYRIDSDS